MRSSTAFCVDGEEHAEAGGRRDAIEVALQSVYREKYVLILFLTPFTFAVEASRVTGVMLVGTGFVDAD